MTEHTRMVVQLEESGRLFLIEETRRNYGSKHDTVDTGVKWLSQAPASDGTYDFKTIHGQVMVQFESPYGTGEEPTAKVNWSAHGAQPIDHAEGYAATIALGVRVAQMYESYADAETPMTLAEMAKQWRDAPILYDSTKDNIPFEYPRKGFA